MSTEPTGRLSVFEFDFTMSDLNFIPSSNPTIYQTRDLLSKHLPEFKHSELLVKSSWHKIAGMLENINCDPTAPFEDRVLASVLKNKIGTLDHRPYIELNQEFMKLSEQVINALTLWASEQHAVYTINEWNLDIVEYYLNSLSLFNQYHWVVEIYPDKVIMPNGDKLLAYQPSPAQDKLLQILCDDRYDEYFTDMAPLIEEIKTIPESHLESLTGITKIFNDYHDFIDDLLTYLQALKKLTSYPLEDLEKIKHTISVLAEDWGQTVEELLASSAILLHTQPVH